MTPRKNTPIPLPDAAREKQDREPAVMPVPVRHRGAFRDPVAEGKAFVYSPTLAVPEGTVTKELPSKKNPTKYDWDTVRTLLENNPGLWVLALSDMSKGMYSYVRAGKVGTFAGMGGHMQVSLRNQRDSKRVKGKVGDLWLRWIPASWSADDQARAEAALAAGEGVL